MSIALPEGFGGIPEFQAKRGKYYIGEIIRYRSKAGSSSSEIPVSSHPLIVAVPGNTRKRRLDIKLRIALSLATQSIGSWLFLSKGGAGTREK